MEIKIEKTKISYGATDRFLSNPLFPTMNVVLFEMKKKKKKCSLRKNND